MLKELGTAIGGLGPAGGVQAAAADEWQQLHLAPFEGIAESSGESPLAIKVQHLQIAPRLSWPATITSQGAQQQRYFSVCVVLGSPSPGEVGRSG